MSQVRVYGVDGHVENHRISTASCFFFPTLELDELIASLSGKGEAIVALPGRIEVSDANAPLHYHNNATIAFIAYGHGVIKTVEGEERVRTGDVVLIPAGVPHVSIADPGTVMVEYTITLGIASDLQDITVN